MCRYAFYKKCWFYLFKEQFISLFCPIAHSLKLSFIVYSTLKQCWSVGYVSLLTLSFIYTFSSTSRPLLTIISMLQLYTGEGCINSSNFFILPSRVLVKLIFIPPFLVLQFWNEFSFILFCLQWFKPCSTSETAAAEEFKNKDSIITDFIILSSLEIKATVYNRSNIHVYKVKFIKIH